MRDQIREIKKGFLGSVVHTLRQHELGIAASLQLHWPEYAMEFAEMAVYLCCTCIFATLLQHPASPVRHFVPNALVRRALFGASIGTTLIAIALTPWGKQSGGHLNPAMTFAFFRLGKLHFWDAAFYGLAQFTGAITGVDTAFAGSAGGSGDSLCRDYTRTSRIQRGLFC